MSEAYVNTTDPLDVSRVWWCVGSERVSDCDADGEPIETDDRTYRARMQLVLDALFFHITTDFPLATDVRVINGGWENQYSPWSPRAETEDGAPYEYFFDWASDAEDVAVNAAFAAFPTPDVEEES